eukprot:TRINITY_DN6667_c0_g5_i2.p1 TRINITY_DN6667_c0_g5~~TRINITY_DN6667_c0_g5_i2.p1  ORF type:complete len:1135 (-),score=303.39 TRINITY_DN6667_c0_g5_i2:650-3859(-)
METGELEVQPEVAVIGSDLAEVGVTADAPLPPQQQARPISVSVLHLPTVGIRDDALPVPSAAIDMETGEVDGFVVVDAADAAEAEAIDPSFAPQAVSTPPQREPLTAPALNIVQRTVQQKRADVVRARVNKPAALTGLSRLDIESELASLKAALAIVQEWTRNDRLLPEQFLLEVISCAMHYSDVKEDAWWQKLRRVFGASCPITASNLICRLSAVANSGVPFQLVLQENLQLLPSVLLDRFAAQVLESRRRVRVVSVVGPGRTGRSTLLNCAFGSRFRAQTQGISATFLSEVECEPTNLILLDTAPLWFCTRDGAAVTGSKSQRPSHAPWYQLQLMLTALASSHIVIVNTTCDTAERVCELVLLAIAALRRLRVRPMWPRLMFVVRDLNGNDREGVCTASAMIRTMFGAISADSDAIVRFKQADVFEMSPAKRAGATCFSQEFIAECAGLRDSILTASDESISTETPRPSITSRTSLLSRLRAYTDAHAAGPAADLEKKQEFCSSSVMSWFAHLRSVCETVTDFAPLMPFEAHSAWQRHVALLKAFAVDCNRFVVDFRQLVQQRMEELVPSEVISGEMQQLQSRVPIAQLELVMLQVVMELNQTLRKNLGRAWEMHFGVQALDTVAQQPPPWDVIAETECASAKDTIQLVRCARLRAEQLQAFSAQLQHAIMKFFDEQTSEKVRKNLVEEGQNQLMQWAAAQWGKIESSFDNALQPTILNSAAAEQRLFDCFRAYALLCPDTDMLPGHTLLVAEQPAVNPRFFINFNAAESDHSQRAEATLRALSGCLDGLRVGITNFAPKAVHDRLRDLDQKLHEHDILLRGKDSSVKRVLMMSMYTKAACYSKLTLGLMQKYEATCTVERKRQQDLFKLNRPLLVGQHQLVLKDTCGDIAIARLLCKTLLAEIIGHLRTEYHQQFQQDVAGQTYQLVSRQRTCEAAALVRQSALLDLLLRPVQTYQTEFEREFRHSINVFCSTRDRQFDSDVRRWLTNLVSVVQQWADTYKETLLFMLQGPLDPQRHKELPELLLIDFADHVSGQVTAIKQRILLMTGIAVPEPPPCFCFLYFQFC